jgi:predicted RecA/RadA family phage recombinase
MANDCIPLFEPGDRVTGLAAANPVVGKTFVALDVTAGNKWTGPAISDVKHPDIAVVTATADGPVFGVAAYDAAKGATVTVIRGQSMIVPVTTGTAITAGQNVSTDGAGKAKPAAAGTVVGIAINDAAVGADCYIDLKRF